MTQQPAKHFSWRIIVDVLIVLISIAVLVVVNGPWGERIVSDAATYSPPWFHAAKTVANKVP
jgi:hypothetical protein